MASRELDPVRVVTTTNITLSGLQSYDGVSLLVGDPVLVAGQDDASLNGPYRVQDAVSNPPGGAWTRREDFDTQAEMLPTSWLTVMEGNTPGIAGSVWYFANSVVPSLGTTLLNWKMRSRGAVEKPGPGVELTSQLTYKLTDTGVSPGTYSVPILDINAQGRATAAEASGINTTFIEGLGVVRNSGTSITVKMGAAWVEGRNKIVELAADTTKGGLSLAASTLYSIYLFEPSADVGDVEIVTTAPAAPYRGEARSKSGDTTRRYIGWALTDGTGAIVEVASQFAGVIPEPWTAPTLVNGWVNSPSYDDPAGYYKDPSGIVRLRGLVQSGTANTMFTLPAGYRPRHTKGFLVPAATGGADAARITIDSAGVVVRANGLNNNVSLAGIAFRAEG